VKRPTRDELLNLHEKQLERITSLELELAGERALLFAVEESLVEVYGWEPPINDLEEL
jgi:hypothetical protein